MPGGEGPRPVAEGGTTMTGDEALMRVRERAGGDLSCVPGPVIVRAIGMMMMSGEEDER